MTESFRDKARIYYGGDFQLLGGVRRLGIDDTEAMLSLLKPLVPSDVVVTSRVEFDSRSYSLFYEGTELALRVIKGVDFEAERDLFSRFAYAANEGGAPDPATIAGTNGILLSERTASKLGARVGDEVTFFCRTMGGYFNTVRFRVAGIFLDSSVLGLYTAYCDGTLLRSVMGASPNFSNRISFIFPKPPSKRDIERYQMIFSQALNMYPLVSDKQAFYTDLIDRHVFGDTPAYAIITLDANQDDVKELSSAMNAIFAIIVAMLSLIIIAGVASAYRVIVLKRISEIGVYMSIGMRSRRIAAILFLETMALLVAGSTCGLLLSGVLCAGVGLVDLTAIPGIYIFLNQGAITPMPTFGPPALFCLGVFVTTGLAVLFTIRRVVTISPVEAIRMI